MRLFKKTKLVVTALVLGLPIIPILQDGQDSKAMMKVGSTATKITNTIKTGLTKPPIAPKPTNITKIQTNITSKTTSSLVSTPKGNVAQKVTAFNNNSPSNGKAMGPISQKVAELNLSAKIQNDTPKISSKNGVVNSAIKSLNKTDSSYQKQTTSSKLNIDSSFKNKLNSILGSGGKKQTSSNSSSNSNQTTTGKLNLNNESSKKLESIFGGATSNKTNVSSNSSSSTSQAFENTDPSIPTAPPLPGSSNTLTQTNTTTSTTQSSNTLTSTSATTPNIPDAPPLPEQKPVTTIATSNGGSLQNQLTSKLNSGLNKTDTTSTNAKKLSNTSGNTLQDQLIKELNSRFNKN